MLLAINYSRGHLIMQKLPCTNWDALNKFTPQELKEVIHWNIFGKFQVALNFQKNLYTKHYVMKCIILQRKLTKALLPASISEHACLKSAFLKIWWQDSCTVKNATTANCWLVGKWFAGTDSLFLLKCFSINGRCRILYFTQSLALTSATFILKPSRKRSRSSTVLDVVLDVTWVKSAEAFITVDSMKLWEMKNGLIGFCLVHWLGKSLNTSNHFKMAVMYICCRTLKEVSFYKVRRAVMVALYILDHL